ncbi:hypothetical protein NUW58_g5745 [Xylaria curta]|uniref:Uncharacterized protein n=2 Tax=Xylaria curta TaxID=42375 RepID=A0ACC1NWZ0_9PEZI|nr:hypothetical protein NUW58_g6335 [Xylaria curta]KAJ2985042.1 hypothetical protein NUW58_g5745 [Xylaria curta]
MFRHRLASNDSRDLSSSSSSGDYGDAHGPPNSFGNSHLFVRPPGHHPTRSQDSSEEGEPSIVAAIKGGDVSWLQQLLNDTNDKDYVERGSDGMCGLHWAAKLGRLDMLKLLLTKTDLEDTDERGRTALFHAIENDTEAPGVIDFLLGNGANVSHRDLAGNTALRLAAEKGKIPTVRKLIGLDGITFLDIVQSCDEHDDAESVKVKSVGVLLDCGADIGVCTKEGGDSVLHIVAWNGCTPVLDLGGGFPQLTEARNDVGYTPLHFAVQNDRENVARALVERYSANIEAKTSRNWTPLHLASRGGNTKLASFLMEKGADIMATTATGYTAVYLACFARHDELAATILSHMNREQALAVTNDEEEPLLSAAVSHECLQVVKRLVQYAREDDTSGRLLSESFRGQTPVLAALAVNRYDIAELLVDNGASTAGTDDDGNTALHLASAHGMTEMLTSLLESHAEDGQLLTLPNKQGMSPLHCAAAGLHTSVVRLLLERSDPQRVAGKATDGWAALHWAAWYQRLDLIKLLINNHAELPMRDNSNRTAFDVAKELGTSSIEILEWLTLYSPNDTHTYNPRLKRPAPESRAIDLCKETHVHLMDVFSQAEMEKSGFTVFEVLYEWGPNSLMTMVANAQRIQEPLKFRWIHFPRNNKIWVKDLILAIYFDKIKSLGSSKSGKKVNRRSQHFEAPSKTSGAREWERGRYSEDERNKMQRPKTIRIEMIGPKGRRLETPLRRGPDKPKVSPKKQTVAEYHRLRRFVDNFLTQAVGVRPFRYMTPLFEEYKEQRGYASTHRVALSIPYFSLERLGDSGRLRRASQQYAVQISDRTERDGNETGGGMTWHATESENLRDGSLHFSWTLDEFHYIFMTDTNYRNTDQVVCRHQGRIASPHKPQDRLICMVDQLWLFIVDDETIVTSTSERQSGNSTTIQDAISNHFAQDKDKRPQFSSVLGMIPLIVSLCCRRPLELKLDAGENFLQVFGLEIARAANREVELFDQFIRSLKAPNHPVNNSEKSWMGGILEEIELLKEVKDILDELNIIRTVLSDQMAILNALMEKSAPWDHASRVAGAGDLRESFDYYRTFSKLETTLKEVYKLIGDAQQTRGDLNHLLDLRQKDANLSEAISARTYSESTARQGKTILVFTVVTVVFLPITFLSSLFALNVASFPHDEAGELSYSPEWAYSRLFGITIAVSLPLVILAFFMDWISDFASGSLAMIASRNERQALQEIYPGDNRADAMTGAMPANLEESTALNLFNIFASVFRRAILSRRLLFAGDTGP